MLIFGFVELAVSVIYTSAVTGRELDFQIWNLEERCRREIQTKGHQLVDGTETKKQRPFVKKNEES